MKRPAVTITAVTIMLASVLAAPSPAAAATVRLVPNADIASTWQATPAGPAWSTLDDTVSQPDPVDATDRIWAGAANRVAHLALDTTALGGGYGHSGVVRFYANTGSGTRLQVEVLSRGTPLNSAVVAAGSGFGWRQVPFPAVRQGGLEVRLTALDGGDTNVRALYASAQSAAFRAVVDAETAANRQIIEVETPDWNRQVGPYAHGATVVTSPTRTGAYAARFELRQGETASANLKSRAEVTTAYPDAGVIERWYGFSIYLPADTWAPDTLAEILTQWHQADASAATGSPPLSVGTRNGKWEVALFGAVLDSPTLSTSYATGAWTDWVVHVRWSADATGFFEMWRGNQPVKFKLSPTSPEIHRVNGVTSYDNLGVHTKFGIYKWGWNGLPANPNNKRVIFYDDLRIADQTAGHAAVRP